MKNSKYQKLVAAGCSFTACSSSLAQKPLSWAGMLAHSLGVDIFANLAIPGGGNTAMAHNVMHFLQTKPHFSNQNSLVVFNITGVDRIDTICESDHPDTNGCFSWYKDLGTGWITEGGFQTVKSPFYGARQKHQGYAPTCVSSVLQVISLTSYLTAKQFAWYFMIMDQGVLTNSPTFFRSFLDSVQAHWIKPDGYETMLDFCQAKNLVLEDNFHPSLDGHTGLHHAVLNVIKGES